MIRSHYVTELVGLIVSMQWKFVSLAPEEHNQTGLEAACPYGIRYSECLLTLLEKLLILF